MRKDFYILFILLTLILSGCSKQETEQEALALETVEKDLYIQELEGALTEHEKVIDKLNNTISNYKIQMATQENELSTLKNQQSTLNEELKSFTIENKDLLSKVNNAQDKKNYNIYSKHEQIDETNVIISYPQIYGQEIEYNLLSDINKVIYTDVLDLLDPYTDLLETLTLDIFFEVKLASDRIISITYWGFAMEESFPHPHKIYHTTNIDLTTGSKIHLTDVIDISPDFVSFFMDKNFEYIGPLLLDDSDIDSIYNQYTDLDYLLLQFKYADTEESSVSSYFTDEGLIIVTDANHAIGGYAEFFIDYKGIENYMTSDIFTY